MGSVDELLFILLEKDNLTKLYKQKPLKFD